MRDWPLPAKRIMGRHFSADLVEGNIAKIIAVAFVFIITHPASGSIVLISFYMPLLYIMAMVLLWALIFLSIPDAFLSLLLFLLCSCGYPSVSQSVILITKGDYPLSSSTRSALALPAVWWVQDGGMSLRWQLLPSTNILMASTKMQHMDNTQPTPPCWNRGALCCYFLNANVSHE